MICIFEFLRLIVLQKYNSLYIWGIFLYRILHNWMSMNNHHFHLGNILLHIFYINLFHRYILSNYFLLQNIFLNLSIPHFHLGKKHLSHILYIILLLGGNFHNDLLLLHILEKLILYLRWLNYYVFIISFINIILCFIVNKLKEQNISTFL